MPTKPLTVRQASESLGLSEHTLRSWIGSRRISFIRLGRAIRIQAEEVERILAAGTIPARASRNVPKN